MSDEATGDVHRCSECGLMGIRSDGERKLIEAEWLLREEGQPPSSGVSERLPECLVRAGLEQREFAGREQKHVKETVNRDRHCDRFTTWIPGHSPRQHLEMIELEEIRQADREFQKAREDAQRAHNRRTLMVSLAEVAIAACSAFKGKKASPPPVVNVIVPADANPAVSTQLLPANPGQRQVTAKPEHWRASKDGTDG